MDSLTDRHSNDSKGVSEKVLLPLSEIVARQCAATKDQAVRQKKAQPPTRLCFLTRSIPTAQQIKVTCVEQLLKQLSLAAAQT